MRLPTICLSALLLTSCKLGPIYNPPHLDAPNEWKAPQRSALTSVENWWNLFGDCKLDELESLALELNPGLEIACQRVAEARARIGIAQADLAPQINISPSYSNSGELFQFFLPPGVLPPNSNFPDFFRIHQMQYVLPLTMNYEIDLWGKNRNRTNSFCFAAQAEEEAYRSALLSLTSEVASTYFLIRSLDSQIELSLRQVELQKKNFTLQEARFSKGLATQLDVTEAVIQLNEQESIYLDLKMQRALLEDSLATLIGLAPADFTLEPSPITAVPPTVPSALPSEVLLQRPDIAQAERMSASEHAQIGVAWASFFPSLSITATAGYLSPDFSQFLHWISRLWSLGANANQMIFDGGRASAEVQIAWARYGQASANFQQQVLIAFREVEDALNSLEYQHERDIRLSKAEESATKRAELSNQRFKKGIATSLEVIQNELKTIEVSLAKSNLLGQQYLSTIQLIKALGGSWLFQPPLEEPCSPCECTKSNDHHGPEITENNMCRHGL